MHRLRRLTAIAGLLVLVLDGAPVLAQPPSLEEGVLAEANFARAHPVDYARRLREYRDSEEGQGGGYIQPSIEGPRAIDEAIGFLERQRPLAPLKQDTALARVAADYAADQGPRSLVGHVGSDGATLGERLRRLHIWYGQAAEDISYGKDTAASVVRQLIIDDGVRSRGHRATLFDPGLQYAGVGCGPHETYGYMCVIDFVGAMAGR